jgi:ABC-type dipeptide/oligopeptide/nickel transport system permease component
LTGSAQEVGACPRRDRRTADAGFRLKILRNQSKLNRFALARRRKPAQRGRAAAMIFTLDFFIRRLAQGVVIVALVALLVFTLLRVVPGDPVRIMLGPMTPPSVMEATAKKLGLRDPIPIQFGRYMLHVLRGDFGHSFLRSAQGGSTGGSRGANTFDTSNRASVAGLIAASVPYSLMLAAMGVLFSFMIAIPIGVAAGLNAGGWPNRAALYISSILVSLPNVWLGVVFIFIFSAKLEWLPAIGYKNFGYTILPALVLAIELAPIMIRSISVSVASNLIENYVAVGEVRGLTRLRMITHHVFRNASIPLLNLVGVQIIGMLLGSLFVVEYIFNYPGVGLLMINAVFERDFPIIQAIAILASVVLVCVNILVDFAATNIDRRLQY